MGSWCKKKDLFFEKEYEETFYPIAERGAPAVLLART
jgi:hypothetical protein